MLFIFHKSIKSVEAILTNVLFINVQNQSVTCLFLIIFNIFACLAPISFGLTCRRSACFAMKVLVLIVFQAENCFDVLVPEICT